MKFNYKVLRIIGIRPETLEPRLNQLGAEGYEFKFANEVLLILSKPYTSPAKELPTTKAEPTPT